MKAITKLIFLLLITILFTACSKECPEGIKYTYRYYNIGGNIDKRVFPYQFNDTQVWINVNTNDTLHYVLKDTVINYDTTRTSIEAGCPAYDVVYNDKLTYMFQCLEDASLNYDYSYLSSNGIGYNPSLKFNKISYYSYIKTYDSISNYYKTYTEVRDRKYFWENFENGIVRITINNIKLYRIK